MRRDPWLHPLRALAIMLAASVMGCSALADAPLGTDPISATIPASVTTTPQFAVVPMPAPGKYNRDAFGPAWADVDRNGCDTRNDILARDLEGETFRPGTHDCVVITGTLRDPYTGTTVPFAKERAGDVQIDHIVPLSWAWNHGAWAWTAEQRLAFANDPRNLQATIGKVNASKGDSGPESWLPPDQSYWCTYKDRFMTAKLAYGLDVDFTLRCKKP